MSSTKKIILIETIVLLVPVTLLALPLCIIQLQAVVAAPVESLALRVGLLSVISVVGLVSGWWLVLVYLEGGLGRLTGVARWHFVGVLGAAVIAALGLASRLAAIDGVFSPFALGSPALVVFAHLGFLLYRYTIKDTGHTG